MRRASAASVIGVAVGPHGPHDRSLPGKSFESFSMPPPPSVLWMDSSVRLSCRGSIRTPCRVSCFIPVTVFPKSIALCSWTELGGTQPTTCRLHPTSSWNSFPLGARNSIRPKPSGNVCAKIILATKSSIRLSKWRIACRRDFGPFTMIPSA